MAAERQVINKGTTGESKVTNNRAAEKAQYPKTGQQARAK
jgi:hypothetical protein